MNEIPAFRIWRMIENAIKFPYPQICKHLVAADLLSLLEQYGVVVSEELAKAIVSADDEAALLLLRSSPMANKEKEMASAI